MNGSSCSSAVSNTVANDAISELRRLEYILSQRRADSSTAVSPVNTTSSLTLHTSTASSSSACERSRHRDVDATRLPPPPPHRPRASSSTLRHLSASKYPYTGSAQHSGAAASSFNNSLAVNSVVGTSSAASNTYRGTLSTNATRHHRPVVATSGAIATSSDADMLRKKIQQTLRSSREMQLLLVKQHDLLEEAQKQLAIMNRRR